MKVLTALIMMLSLIPLAQAEVTREGNHTNPSNRTERNIYHGSPNEVIWTEFGRPYWRPAGVAAVTTTKAIDTDRDGVNNDLDQCPGTAPGVKVNAFGCTNDEKVSINLGVKFASGKSILDPAYTAQLDRLAKTMKKHEDLKIEIQGHTDNTGKRSYNVWISEQRSKAVKSYLINEHGIDGSRLVAKGYGPDQPTTSNDTAEGRRNNRRVEGRILSN